MINNEIQEILHRIEHIERRPLMYGVPDSYKELSALITGYFLGLDTTLKMDLNNHFRNWIQAKSPKIAVTWQESILRFLADNNEVRAREMLFSELKTFLKNLIEENNL